jgi:hypothetical protein
MSHLVGWPRLQHAVILLKLPDCGLILRWGIPDEDHQNFFY